ncbi:sensor histidine kinase [Streptomyces griseoloalbus]|uniref:histidine kinase n=1 Tax=Streptomyces griseoloalbus TaxID=67303 RepID=A0A7W8FB82_9ACTN|nr:sensor histidine kinase [Streptomyces albaduncus]MBB5127156.1 signal transduction histidine kinase [Streptomyces albaduncus]GGW44536.1 two-component sensor histidine kinase [Streptomyces albaduncus]
MTSVEEERPRALLAGASRRWVRLLPWGVAFVLCVALLPTTIQVLSADYGLNGGIASALAVAQAAPLLLAVVRPLRAWYVILTADVAGALALLTVDFEERLLWPFPPMEIVGYVGLCLALAGRERRRTLLLVWLATAGANIGLGFAAPYGASAKSVLLTMLSGVALLLGGALRERYEVQRRLAEQETISEAERERRTLLEERARIARELHDVVAHHMSVITVQADTAAYRLDGLPPDVREEFTSIAATARESLGEMRRLLGVLRNEEAHGELAPQPGLTRIGQMVEATMRAGVPVEFTPCDTDVPEAVGLSAYRIVQEALANVVRHAPGAPTRVSVTESVAQDGARLTVLVVNGPPPEPPAAPLEEGGTGHGLVGMRERVRLAGGSLDAGPLPDGGFRVAAQLPLSREDFT